MSFVKYTGIIETERTKRYLELVNDPDKMWQETFTDYKMALKYTNKERAYIRKHFPELCVCIKEKSCYIFKKRD